MKNSVQIQGRLTRAPHFSYVNSKNGTKPFLRFTLAVARRPPHDSGTDYVPVYVFGRRALLDQAFLKKGSEILVDGWLRTRKGEDSAGKEISRIEVIGLEITFLRNVDWKKGCAQRDQLREQEQKMGIVTSLPIAPAAA